MQDYRNSERVKARNQADVNEAMVRHIAHEEARLMGRIKLLQGEISGAQKVIEAKQSQILAAENQIQTLQWRAESLRQQIDHLHSEAAELETNLEAWNNHRAG